MPHRIACCCAGGAAMTCTEYPALCVRSFPGDTEARIAWWQGIQSRSARTHGTLAVTVTKNGTTLGSATLSLEAGYRGTRTDQGTDPTPAAPDLPGPWPTTLEDEWVLCARYYVPVFAAVGQELSYPLALMLGANPADCCAPAVPALTWCGLHVAGADVDALLADVGALERDQTDAATYADLADRLYLNLSADGLVLLVSLEDLLAASDGEATASDCAATCDPESVAWKVWRPGGQGMTLERSTTWTDGGDTWGLELTLELSTSCWCRTSSSRRESCGCRTAPAEWFGPELQIEATLALPGGGECSSFATVAVGATVTVGSCCHSCVDSGTPVAVYVDCENQADLDARLAPLYCVTDAPPTAVATGQLENTAPDPIPPGLEACYGCVSVVEDPPGAGTVAVTRALVAGCDFTPQVGSWPHPWLPNGMLCVAGGGTYDVAPGYPPACSAFTFTVDIGAVAFFRVDWETCDCPSTSVVLYDPDGVEIGSATLAAVA